MFIQTVLTEEIVESIRYASHVKYQLDKTSLVDSTVLLTEKAVLDSATDVAMEKTIW